jgi:hypothetical protein
MFRRMREKRQEIMNWQVASGLCRAHSDSAGPFLRELSQRPSGSVESINRALVFAGFPLAHAGAHHNATSKLFISIHMESAGVADKLLQAAGPREARDIARTAVTAYRQILAAASLRTDYDSYDEPTVLNRAVHQASNALAITHREKKTGIAPWEGE